MARDTRERLLDSALALFSKRWYETVSVAEICRAAGLSNGIFYRYFKDKERIFKVIVDDFLLKFADDLSVVGRHESIEENLADFIAITVGIARRYGREVSVFREGQYRFLNLERELRTLYMGSLERVYRRTLSEAEYLYVVSGIRFLATRGIYNAIDVDEAHLARLILNGVFSEGTIPEQPDPGPLESPLDFTDVQTSKVRLAEAGIRLFGVRGYYDVGVSEICLTAGLSVGTFYQHYSTKEEFLDFLVKTIGHSVRFFLREKVAAIQTGGDFDARDRLYREVTGMGYFARYFTARPEFYSIVRQAEFVSDAWVKNYYDRFEAGYRKNLGIADGKAAATTANFLMGLSHYLGIEVIFSDRVNNISELLRTLGRFLKFGVSR